MKRLSFSDPEDVKARLEMAVEVVAAGGVVLIPTESFYGSGSRPAERGGGGTGPRTQGAAR